MGQKPKTVDVGTYVVTVDGERVMVARKGESKNLLVKTMSLTDVGLVWKRLHSATASKFLQEWLRYPDNQFVDKITVATHVVLFNDTTVTFQEKDSHKKPRVKTYDSMHAVRIIHGRLKNDPQGRYLGDLLRRIDMEALKAGFAAGRVPAEKVEKPEKPAKGSPRVRKPKKAPTPEPESVVANTEPETVFLPTA